MLGRAYGYNEGVMLDQIFGSLWALLYLVVVVGMVLLVLVRKRESSSAIGWSLAIVLLPVLGSLLFCTFGMTRLPRRLRQSRQAVAPTRDRGPAGPAADA